MLLETYKNCIAIFAKYKASSFHLNIFQGNNFPKQYHALNTVFRSFYSAAEISNIFYKIKYNSHIFSICVNLKWWSKFPSIQLNQRLYYKKAVLESFKNFAEKTLYMVLFLNKVPGLYPESFFQKKGPMCTFFPVSFAKYFRGPFL